MKLCLFKAAFLVAGAAAKCSDNPRNNADDCTFLQDLYTSTAGDRWTNASNWLTDASVCDWYGVECSIDGTRVNKTELGSNNLQGSIPASIMGTRLWGFDVSENKMSGPIPNEIGSVSTLWGMNLARPKDGFGLTGTIPSSIGQIAGLQLFGAPDNKLTGTLPAEFASLSSLRIIDVSNNQLTGSISSGMCTFVSGLQHCFADSNQFDCPAECLIAQCGLQSCKPTSGGSCGDNPQNNDDDCRFLEDLYASTGGPQWTDSTNWMTDESVCDWFGVECSIDGQRVNKTEVGSNNLFGSIPPSIQNTRLWGLDLSQNKLIGPIPSEIGSVSTLWGINLAESITGFGLTGTIPSSIGQITGLQLFGASHNRLTGTIPPEIGSLSDLRILDVSSNELSGTISPSMCTFVSGLQHCFAETNQFECPANCLRSHCGVLTCHQSPDPGSGSSMQGLDNLVIGAMVLGAFVRDWAL